MVVLKKGMRPTKKKKQIIFKNKIETNVPNKKNLGRTHKFCFTNMKTDLQKCVPNKLIVSPFYYYFLVYQNIGEHMNTKMIFTSYFT